MNQFIKASTHWLSAIGYRLILSVLVSNFAVTASAVPYRASADGSVVWDQATGLVWMRCSYGESWNGKNCAGESKTVKFDYAKNRIDTFNEVGLAGFKDWVMPTAEQLISIRTCTNEFVGAKHPGEHKRLCTKSYTEQTIDTKIFPFNKDDNKFWTASIYEQYKVPYLLILTEDGDATWRNENLSGSHISILYDYGGWKLPMRLVRNTLMSNSEAALSFPVRLSVTTNADRASEASKIEAQWRREAPVREAKEREENRRREAYERTPAGRAEAQQRQQQQQGRQMCEAQKQTCFASCPQWRDGANNYAAFSCEKDCQKISCN